MIARTDFSGNIAQGIPNPHYHLYQYGPGLSPKGFEYGKHIGGVYKPW
jgi:hypothetical protein